jgi:uncharacterized membrane protein
MNNPNPYEAPRAVLEAPSDEDDGFLGEPRTDVGIGAGADWLGFGWNYFKEAPLLWIGIFVVFMVITFIMNLVPILGLVINGLLGPVLTAGIFLVCESQRREGQPDFAKLFAGFTTNTAALLVIGAINVVFAVGMQIGVSAAMFGPSVAFEGFMAMMGIGQPPQPNFDVGRMLGMFALIFVVAIPFGFAMWLAPAQVAINGVAPIDALRRSLVACLRNFGTVFVYGLMLMGLGIAATLPCLLGWLVAMPMMFCAQYAAYRNFFYD